MENSGGSAPVITSTSTTYSPSNTENHFDEFPEENYEQLFDAQEKKSYKIFCRNMIHDHLSTFAMKDPPSPFAGKDDEVDEMFDNFLIECPGEKGDIAYLRLREDPNEITVALSMEEIRELDCSGSLRATAQHIDSYLQCRLSLFPSEIQQRINRCSAYMISLNIENLDHWNDAAPLRILEKALDNEIKNVDFNLIPLLYREHWTLAIVCGLGQQRNEDLPSVPFGLPCVLHFNSLGPSLAVGVEKCHAYAIANVVAKKAQIDESHVKCAVAKKAQIDWYEIDSPQQRNAMDCGFYVMRFAVDFVKNLCSPHPLPVADLFYLFQSCQDYTEAAQKARQQLKGFIGSIRPEERDWKNAVVEFSEGRPCTIEYLDYCIPEKILKAEGNEFQVKMFNFLRVPYVPSEYVKKHWKHIYDDYITSQEKDN